MATFALDMWGRIPPPGERCAAWRDALHSGLAGFLKMREQGTRLP